MSIHDLTVKIFADGADLGGMIDLARQSWVKGFTTNPTLMAKAGVRERRAHGHSRSAHLLRSVLGRAR